VTNVIDSLAIETGQIYGNQTGQYTVQSDDIGNQIFVEVTYLDGKGVQKTIASNYVTIEVPAEDSQNVGGTDTTIEVSDNPYTGTVIAQGAGLKTVKLLSTDYLITYQVNGYNPDIKSYTITANAFEHVEPVTYKFYKLTGDADVEILKGPNDTNITRIIDTNPIYTAETVYRVDTLEEQQGSTIIASDLVIIYGVKE